MMDEGILHSENVMFVFGIPGIIEEFQDGDFHHTLAKVGLLILDDLDGDDLVSLDVLTFDDLTEGALTEDVEDQVLVTTTRAQGLRTIRIG